MKTTKDTDRDAEKRERRRAQNRKAAATFRAKNNVLYEQLMTQHHESSTENIALKNKKRELEKEKNAMLLELKNYEDSTSSQSSGLVVDKLLRNMSIDESEEKGEANILPEINSATMPTQKTIKLASLASKTKMEIQKKILSCYTTHSLENAQLAAANSALEKKIDNMRGKLINYGHANSVVDQTTSFLRSMSIDNSPTMEQPTSQSVINTLQREQAESSEPVERGDLISATVPNTAAIIDEVFELGYQIGYQNNQFFTSLYCSDSTVDRTEILETEISTLQQEKAESSGPVERGDLISATVPNTAAIIDEVFELGYQIGYQNNQFFTSLYCSDSTVDRTEILETEISTLQQEKAESSGPVEAGPISYCVANARSDAPSLPKSNYSVVSKQQDYFWAYNKRGPKAKKAIEVTLSYDPHRFIENKDPVNGNTIYFNLANALEQLNNAGNKIDVLQLNRPNKTDKKPRENRDSINKKLNRLATYVSRQKFKASKAANEIKLNGLQKEHAVLKETLDRLYLSLSYLSLGVESISPSSNYQPARVVHKKSTEHVKQTKGAKNSRDCRVRKTARTQSLSELITHNEKSVLALRALFKYTQKAYQTIKKHTYLPDRPDSIHFVLYFQYVWCVERLYKASKKAPYKAPYDEIMQELEKNIEQWSTNQFLENPDDDDIVSLPIFDCSLLSSSKQVAGNLNRYVGYTLSAHKRHDGILRKTSDDSHQALSSDHDTNSDGKELQSDAEQQVTCMSAAASGSKPYAQHNHATFFQPHQQQVNRLENSAETTDILTSARYKQ